jgi:protein-tyrosine phosphatase
VTASTRDDSPDRYRVLFVCMGNICRSPMAESVLRTKLTEAGLSDCVVVDSAGTGSWHVGEPADRRTRQALQRRGYPDAHVARVFEPGWFDERDLVVALDLDNRRALQRMAPNRDSANAVRLLREFDPDADSLEVPDPYYGGTGDFDVALDQVEAACDGLVDHLRVVVNDVAC